MNAALEFVKTFSVFNFNDMMTLLLYWLPFSLCAYGYTIRTWKQYRADLVACSEKFYTPTLTVGSIIGHSIVTICPLANLWVSVFDIGPTLFNGLFKWLGKMFDMPIVRKKNYTAD